MATLTTCPLFKKQLRQASRERRARADACAIASGRLVVFEAPLEYRVVRGAPTYNPCPKRATRAKWNFRQFRHRGRQVGAGEEV